VEPEVDPWGDLVREERAGRTSRRTPKRPWIRSRRSRRKYTSDTRAALRDANAFDFDDLLVKPVEALQAHPDLLRRYRERFHFVLVDEYQDTNRAQYVFLKLIAEKRAHSGESLGRGGNLFVVGDDDQSIYGWRGADVRNILEFEKDFPDALLVRLEENYRSTQRILAAANHVIAENAKRKGKVLRHSTMRASRSRWWRRRTRRTRPNGSPAR
jgi:DNA helicase II / ATP-dependent DNA helicase PcrA